MKPLRIHILRDVYNLREVNFRMLLEDMEDVGGGVMEDFNKSKPSTLVSKSTLECKDNNCPQEKL